MPAINNLSGSSAVKIDPEQWVDKHGDFLYGYALLRIGDPKIAEELLLTTLSAGLAERDKIPEQISKRTWLIGILRRKIIDHYRIVNRQQPFEPIIKEDCCEHEFFSNDGKWLEVPGPWSSAPSKVARQKAFAHAFHICLNVLPSHLAQVFVLRELEGLEVEKICSVTKNSKAIICARLYQSRLRMRRCLGEKCFGEKKTEGLA